MKILVINWQDIKNPFGGGAEVHLHEIFKRIAARGHQVTLLSCKIKGEPERETIDGIDVIRTGSRSLFNFHVPFYYLFKLKKQNFDIIVDDINKIPFYTPLFIRRPLLAISHHFFGKSIFREAGFVAALYVYIAEKFVDFVYKKTPFVVVSESTRQEFIGRGFDPNHFEIVQNAIEPNEFPMKTGEKSTPRNIAYFGRLKKYKSVDHLVRAFATVAEKTPDLKLHIMGRGDFQPELERLCAELGITDKVIFFGFVSEEDKKKLLTETLCVVNTSMKEGWGITNIEANACGTPVISANVPGLRDSVKEGVSGLLYEYGNIEQLAECILKITDKEEILKELSEGALSWAKTFSWEKSSVLMEKRLKQLLK